MLLSFFIALAKFLSGVTIYHEDFIPDEKQRVYFANHTSHIDFIILMAALPQEIRKKTRPLAAKDYWWKSKVRKYLIDIVFNGIVIDRKPSKDKENPIDAMIEGMGEDYSLIMFPEGSRNLEGEIQDFKPGLYHLCQKKPNLELVPVYLNNLSRILPKGEYLPVPFLASARFGSPIRLEENESKQDFLLRAKHSVEKLKHHELHD